MIHIVECFGQAVAHDVGAALGEMDIVAAAETLVHPCRHGVLSAHGVVDAPVGGAVGRDGLLQALYHGGQPVVGEQVALLGAFAHVGRPYEKNQRMGAALVQPVNLDAHVLAVGIDGFLVVEIRHGIAAELQDDEPHAGRG